MVNVRRGINIRTSFAIQRNGVPEDLSQAQNLRVVVRHKCQPNSAATFTGSAVKIEGNSVLVVVTDTMQKTMASGDYIIEAAYRLNNPSAPEGYDPYIIDSDVFTLTDRSADVGGASCGDVTVQVVNISGEVSFCSQALEQLIDEAIAAVQAANEAAQNANDAADAAMAIVDSKVDIDGLNANVKCLQFDTTNPTAPMQIGQIAWDNDEHTLVTHDGLHTHPLGKELELRARNTSGATILNGRACYVTGSTGDNPTIALATNTNGDIAQKTIGVATMDIANNSFGIVTTFGEVNGIDTSALTLGAIVYLGANGQLTTTEPVAPTPKIVIGLCVRQHAQVGKLFVSTRPIARLSKLSEVHAPVLTDNDVLRYNGTTLRWEVYSLAGKADLVGGKIPSAQLPAYVDDVLEYANLAAFPATGESGKIYVALNTNLTYRWSGTTYVEISKSLALGETADTAYRGDRGKTAYDHSQTTGNPHGTTAAQVSNTPAGSVAATTVQGAINELAGDIVQVETDLNEINNLLADYTHTSNKTVIVTSVDVLSGEFTSASHGFVNGDRIGIVIEKIALDKPALYYLPGGITPNSLYYIVEATENTFKLSSNSGGQPIILSTNENLNINMFHFEKPIPGLTIANIPAKKNIRIIIEGGYPGGYVCPNGIGDSMPIFYETGYPMANRYSAISGSRVYCDADIYVSVNKGLYIKYRLFKMTALNITGNTTVQIDNSYYSPKIESGDISFVVFAQAYILNGCKIKIYKV